MSRTISHYRGQFFQSKRWDKVPLRGRSDLNRTDFTISASYPTQISFDLFFSTFPRVIVKGNSFSVTTPPICGGGGGGGGAGGGGGGGG